jgi:nitrate reductase gamma subunit
MEIYIMMGGIVAFVSIIGTMDLLARRQQRRLREQQR